MFEPFIIIFCVYMYMSMYVCIHARGHNFYPIDTKFGTQIGLVKSRVHFEDELCRSHKDTRG